MDGRTPGLPGRGWAQVLDRLAALPGVQDGIDEARDACTQLRWHEALRRRGAEARAEAALRAARCSAALSGARVPLTLLRDAARGAAGLPDDAAGRSVLGALRAVSAVAALGGVLRGAPAQALARLHTAAAAGIVPDDALGRPRPAGVAPGDGLDLIEASGRDLRAPDGEALGARLAALSALLLAPEQAPALLVAALAHAEIATARPFLAANGVVARALCRGVVIGRGLDPTGVGVWEAPLLEAGPRYPLALAAYAGGSQEGVAGWLRMFARAVIDGAGEGRSVCDAVLAGRLPG